MNIAEQIKNGALTDSKTFWGAILPALIFLFFAWLLGRASHLASQRLLAKEREFVSVRLGRRMAIYVGSRAIINE
ncbi:MAG: hypothetical protein ABSG80_16780 [Verrucomicrobiota bacterium]|jgi:hypothetical protein